MPFIKLVDHHSCPIPKTRDDGSALVHGDEWECDVPIQNGGGRICHKRYKWSFDQREGSFWMPIPGG